MAHSFVRDQCNVQMALQNAMEICSAVRKVFWESVKGMARVAGLQTVLGRANV